MTYRDLITLLESSPTPTYVDYHNLQGALSVLDRLATHYGENASVPTILLELFSYEIARAPK